MDGGRNVERDRESFHTSRLTGAISSSFSSVTDLFRDPSGNRGAKFPDKLFKVLDLKMQNIAMGKDPQSVSLYPPLHLLTDFPLQIQRPVHPSRYRRILGKPQSRRKTEFEGALVNLLAPNQRKPEDRGVDPLLCNDRYSSPPQGPDVKWRWVETRIGCSNFAVCSHSARVSAEY